MVTWDEAKRTRNLAKHGLDLADAKGFDWEHAVYEMDSDVGHEQRFRVLSWLDGRLCFLVCTMTEDDVHAISLREADKAEKRRYFQAISASDRR